MVPRRWNVWLLLIALGLMGASCKKAQPPPAGADQDYLTGAIEAQGGLKKLKAASVFTASYEAKLIGTPIKGALKHRTGMMRLEYVSASGEPVVQVSGPDKCWQKFGRVVLPCHESRRTHLTRLSRLLEGTWLWPLKERSDRKIKNEKVEVSGKPYDGVTILTAGGETIGTVLLDPKSGFVAGIKMQTTINGEQGELVGRFSGYERYCGIRIATKRDYTFKGRPFSTEKITGLICKEIEEKEFARPEQVKHGTVVIKHTFDTPIVCTKLKGPLTGVSTAMGQIVDYLSPLELFPTGPAVLIHRKGPPKVKRPAAFLTDVCFPVSKKAWVLPKKTWKGDFRLSDIVGDEVLAAYGIGDHVALTNELPKLLLEGARKRGRKQSGAMFQILYMRPEDYPAEQRVSEMILPLQ